jgi:hypothetical protein
MIAASFQSPRFCQHRLMRFSVYLLLLFSAATVHADGLPRLLPPQAIAFSEFLSKAEFDQRFPGEAVSDPATVRQGWYVRYQHESLEYWFGPLRFAATAEDYATSLRRIVAEAVAQRPELASHSITVLALPTSEAASPNDPAEPVPEEPVADNGVPPPPPPEPWWQRLLGIFRRGS